MPKLVTALVLAIVCLSTPSRADTPAPAMPAETAARLVNIRLMIHTLMDTAGQGIITKAQAAEGAKRYLEMASETAGHPMTLVDLEMIKTPETNAAAPPQQLTALQRAAGYVTFVNILWLLAILLGVACIAVLVALWLVPLFVSIPAQVYEVLFYLAAVGTTIGAHWLSAGTTTFVAFTGCLLLAGALGFSTYLKRDFAKKPWAASLICFLAWTPAAIIYGSEMVGFAAVIALLGTLGFSVIASGMCYCIGFKDEASVGKATTAAFTILGGYVLMRTLGKDVMALRPFETGALFMGSFVGYLGLLICSSRWYKNKHSYALFQVVTVVAGLLALFLGSVFGIGELQKIGGTFFVLYVIEKILEIKTEELVGKAFIGLLAAGAIFVFSMVVKSHPEQFQHFLLVNL